MRRTIAIILVVWAVVIAILVFFGPAKVKSGPLGLFNRQPVITNDCPNGQCQKAPPVATKAAQVEPTVTFVPPQLPACAAPVESAFEPLQTIEPPLLCESPAGRHPIRNVISAVFSLFGRR